MTTKEFQLSETDYNLLMDASKPVPYMIVGGFEPTSPRQKAEEQWKRIGKEMGFKWETARPVRGKSDIFFTAEPIND